VTGKPGKAVGETLADAAGVFGREVDVAGAEVGCTVGASVGVPLEAEVATEGVAIAVGDAGTVADEHAASNATRSVTARTGLKKVGRTKHLLG